METRKIKETNNSKYKEKETETETEKDGELVLIKFSNSLSAKRHKG